MPILNVYDGTGWIEIPVNTDHGGLSGLGDDDHLQYLLADGNRALAGPWDMGSQALINVNIDSGTVDGISSLTSSGNLDIGPHTFRAALLVADMLAAGRFVFTATNGLLAANAKMAFDSGADRVTFSNTDVRLDGIPSGAGAADIRIAGDGDLSFQVSARRFKQDIQEWFGDSSGIFDLVPMTCRMRDDVRKYGDRAPTVLCYIADDSVGMIDPVITHDDNGDPFSIDYKLLTVLIIQELKKQRDENMSQAGRITDIETRLEDLEGR